MYIYTYIYTYKYILILMYVCIRSTEILYFLFSSFGKSGANCQVNPLN